MSKSKFDEVYGSKWLKNIDLDDRRRQFEIEAAEWQEVGHGTDRGEKIILAFVGQKKTMILNPTNGRALADVWGKEVATWPGQWVEAAPIETAFGPSIKLKPIAAPAKSQNARTTKSVVDPDAANNEFNAAAAEAEGEFDPGF